MQPQLEPVLADHPGKRALFFPRQIARVFLPVDGQPHAAETEQRQLLQPQPIRSQIPHRRVVSSYIHIRLLSQSPSNLEIYFSPKNYRHQ